MASTDPRSVPVERRPYASKGRAGEETAPIVPRRRADVHVDKDADKRYGVQELFKILVMVFSSVPTTIYLAWVIAWSTVILYVCTLGFAAAVASIVGLSMFVYGPIICLCIVSAFACSVLYNFGMFLKDLVMISWNEVRRFKNQILGPSTTGPSNDRWSAPTSPHEIEDWRTMSAHPMSGTAATELAPSTKKTKPGAIAGHGGRAGLVIPEPPKQQYRTQKGSGGWEAEVLPYVVEPKRG